jgi:hypothetical protein
MALHRSGGIIGSNVIYPMFNGRNGIYRCFVSLCIDKLRCGGLEQNNSFTKTQKQAPENAKRSMQKKLK